MEVEHNQLVRLRMAERERGVRQQGSWDASDRFSREFQAVVVVERRNDSRGAQRECLVRLCRLHRRGSDRLGDQLLRFCHPAPGIRVPPPPMRGRPVQAQCFAPRLLRRGQWPSPRCQRGWTARLRRTAERERVLPGGLDELGWKSFGVHLFWRCAALMSGWSAVGSPSRTHGRRSSCTSLRPGRSSLSATTCSPCARPPGRQRRRFRDARSARLRRRSPGGAQPPPLVQRSCRTCWTAVKAKSGRRSLRVFFPLGRDRGGPTGPPRSRAREVGGQ